MGIARRGWGMWVVVLLGVQAVPAQERTPLPVAPLLQVAGAEVPVQLREVRIDSEVAAGLGETRIEMRLHNPNNRVLEGELVFPLADGQQVAGFALDIDGELRDAVPVPKQQGRQVFEAITRRQVDPGVVEQVAGNQFRLRVYPIPARGERRVRLVLRQTLPNGPDGLRWVLPLQFARQADQVAVRMQASGTGQPVASGAQPWRFALAGAAYTAQWQGRGTALPAQAQWVLPVVRTTDVVTGVHAGQRYLLAQVPVPATPVARRLPGRVGLLWDASGSAGARQQAVELAVLERYFQALGDGEVQLTVLRDRSEPPRMFPVRAGNWQALRTYLTQLQPDGASALADWQPRADIGEYLLVSDGLANYGPRQLPALGPDQRLYALSSAGAKTDVPRLRAWTAAHQGALLQVDALPDVEKAMPLLLSRGPEVASVRGEGVDAVEVDTGAAAQGWVRLFGRVQRADGAVVVNLRMPDGAARSVRLNVGAARELPGGLVAMGWAQVRRGRLAATGEREAAQALAQAFGLVGADTSLLVLDTLEDYLQYGIRPAGALRTAYDARHAVVLQDAATARQQRLDAIAGQFAERERWWNTAWPKGRPPAPKDTARDRRESAMSLRSAPAPAPASAAAMEIHAEARPADLVSPAPLALAPPPPQASMAAAAGPRRPAGITLALAPWAPDSAYARRLRAAPPRQLYALYLSERAQHADSSAFYLDVADLLLASGQRDLALRVLSNLAEMQLENRHILRVLGYRLLQAKAPALAVPVFGDVLALGEEEPQSFRDLGLALEAAGEYQAAAEALYEVMTRPWDGRFDGISLIALDELTTLIARERVDAAFIDPRLRRAMPLDLRVVLSWDSDNSDMDLWVTDPNGERAYYGNRLTYQGGQMSQDFTGGYGPEQFSLRDAKPGKYTVEANFFGSREQLVTGATTLMLRLSTQWGSRGQRDQQVTLRLKDRAETVLVGEFEVK